MSDEVKQIYDIEDEIGFIYSFSLENEITRLTEQSEELEEEIIFLIPKSTKSLKKECTQWRSFQEEDTSTIIRNIFDLIRVIQNIKDINTEVSFYTYNNKVNEIVFNNSHDVFEQNFINKDEPFNLINALTDLFEKVDNKNKNKKIKGKFLRLVIFTPKIEKKFEIDSLKSILKCFSSSNKNYEGAICNLMLIEQDNLFYKKLNEDIFMGKLTDTKLKDPNLIHKSDEISILIFIYQQKLNSLSKNIKNEIEQWLKKDDILTFARDFDRENKSSFLICQAIIKDLVNFDTGSSKRKKIIKEKMTYHVNIDYIVDKKSKEMIDWINKNKERVNNLVEPIKELVNDFQNQLDEIKNKLGEYLNFVDFWVRRFRFVEGQIEHLDKISKKLEKLEELIKLVQNKMNHTVMEMIETKM